MIPAETTAVSHLDELLFLVRSNTSHVVAMTILPALFFPSSFVLHHKAVLLLAALLWLNEGSSPEI